jgi:hypothetical protein
MAQNGVIYGDTPSGGTSGCGIVFKLTPFGAGYLEKVVYDLSALAAEVTAAHPRTD